MDFCNNETWLCGPSFCLGYKKADQIEKFTRKLNKQEEYAFWPIKE